MYIAIISVNWHKCDCDSFSRTIIIIMAHFHAWILDMCLIAIARHPFPLQHLFLVGTVLGFVKIQYECMCVLCAYLWHVQL